MYHLDDNIVINSSTTNKHKFFYEIKIEAKTNLIF